tara:strand:- start:2345 stop:2527 length:183 start_codon:yes stop_codon:yes gene_type:complete
MSIIGKIYAYRVMPDIHIQLIEVDSQLGTPSVFKYIHLNSSFKKSLDQDRFNAKFMVVVA